MLAAGVVVFITFVLWATFTFCATLDDFNRTSVGPKWVGGSSFLILDNNTLGATAYTSAVYDSVLGKQQSVSGIWKVLGGQEQDLLLKAQGAPGAHIEVRYDANAHLMRVAAYNVAWVDYAQWPCTLVPGDTVTAACDSLGGVAVSRNGASIGVVSVASWPYAKGGGRVGVTMGTQPRLDAIALNGFSVPLPSPYVVWRWTWPSTDALGFPERGLQSGRMYSRVDTTGATWGLFLSMQTFHREGKPAYVSLPKSFVWSWLPARPTRFYVTATDSNGNESAPSNEVLKAP
jgi:hypothetical protein